MRKNRFCLIIPCLLLTLLCSCGAPALDVSKLSGDDGYSYPGLPWGSSLEETERTLGTKLGDPMGAGEPPSGEPAWADRESAVLYPVDEGKQYLTLYGNKGRISYQFFTGRLSDVSVIFKENGPMEGNEIDGLWDTLLEKLTAALGEKTSDEEKELAFGQRAYASRLVEWRRESPADPAVSTFVRLVSATPAGADTPESVTLSVSQFHQTQADDSSGEA